LQTENLHAPETSTFSIGTKIDVTRRQEDIRIHTVGKCEPPAFDSAGPHFNPDGKHHGLDNPAGPHAGDFLNLIA
jgi:Cu-Zn family superoxide dismutase